MKETKIEDDLGNENDYKDFETVIKQCRNI